MELNEKKSFTLEPDQAYGERDENLKQDFPRANVPSQMNPEIGMTIGLQTHDGRQVPGQIIHVDDEKITVDMNHPLAGEALSFEIEVVGISDTPSQSQAGCGAGCDCSSGSCE
jgi:peptidylprolyl isomerase